MRKEIKKSICLLPLLISLVMGGCNKNNSTNNSSFNTNSSTVVVKNEKTLLYKINETNTGYIVSGTKDLEGSVEVPSTYKSFRSNFHYW